MLSLYLWNACCAYRVVVGLRIRSGWLLLFTFWMFGFVNVEKSLSLMLVILKLGLFNGLLVVIRIVCSYIME